MNCTKKSLEGNYGVNQYPCVVLFGSAIDIIRQLCD